MSAESPALRAAETILEIRPAPAPPSVPAAEPVFAIADWRASPAQAQRPDPAIEMSDADMNTWSSVKPGTLQTVPAGHCILYRAKFTPWQSIAGEGGRIDFGRIQGTCEVWLDGKKVAEKSNPDSLSLSVTLPSAEGNRDLTLLMRSAADGRLGIGGAVGVMCHP